MGHWWERDWLRRHAIIAPFGIFAATMLLTWWLEGWQWNGRESWDLALSAVDYGAVIYAMLAVVFEKGGSLVFWAWEKHKERVAQREERMRAYRKQLREELREEGRREEAQRHRAQLDRIANEAREKGITLESLNGLDPDTE